MLKNERCVNLRYNFLIGLWMSWKQGSSSNFNQLCHDTNHCLNAADNSVTRWLDYFPIFVNLQQ